MEGTSKRIKDEIDKGWKVREDKEKEKKEKKKRKKEKNGKGMMKEGRKEGPGKRHSDKITEALS